MTPREQALLQTVNELRIENALLRQKIDLLVKRVFGSSSEQLHPAQQELLMQLPASAPVAVATGTPTPERPPRSPKERVVRFLCTTMFFTIL